MQDAIARSRVRRVDDQGRSQATGKRKTSIARVWLKPGAGHIMVNQRPFDRYFPDLIRRNDLITPFVVTGTLGEFDVMARVHGGGHTGQAQVRRRGGGGGRAGGGLTARWAAVVCRMGYW